MKRFFISIRTIGAGFLLLLFVSALVLSTPLTAVSADEDSVVSASSGESYSGTVDELDGQYNDGDMDDVDDGDMNDDNDSAQNDDSDDGSGDDSDSHDGGDDGGGNGGNEDDHD